MSIISSVSLGSICEGCLSVDRKLTTIDGEESKEFHYILESIDISHTIQLCWECAACLKRSLKFREQVKGARDSIIRFMLNQTTLTSLSRLRITNNDVIQEITYKTETPSENESCHTKHRVKKERGRNTQRKEDEVSKSTVKPVAFIKIEENDDYIDTCMFDVPIVDEGDEDVKESSPLQAELKPDTDLKVPVKRKKRQKVKEDSFNDSDDEPLKKSDNMGEVSRKRRKTREKPAGVISNSRVDRILKQLNVDSGQLEMVLLTWEQVDEERSKALSNETFTRHEYRCYDCVLGFNHSMKLDDHKKKHDPANGTVCCSVCKIVCKDTHSLSAHRRRHRIRWRCVHCEGLFSRAAVAADHLAREHSAPQPFHKCTICGKPETTLGKLRYHMKSHSERQNCELCGKSFRDKSSLRTHLFIHRGEKEYVCPQCDKRFLFKKALEVHMVTHDASQHLYCHQCDMNFKNRMSFYQHMKYSLKHIDPDKLKHTCPICDKRFAKSSRLNEHHIAVHLKHTPISCDQPDCTFSCSSRPVLRTHIRMVHRNARAIRNHVCHNCGKTYTTKKTLEGHLRSHTGERPFCCAVCPAAFGYQAALYNHNKLLHPKQSTRKRAVPATEPLPWLAIDNSQHGGDTANAENNVDSNVT